MSRKSDPKPPSPFSLWLVAAVLAGGFSCILLGLSLIGVDVPLIGKLNSPFISRCEHQIIRVAPSPGEKLQAILFTRQCDGSEQLTTEIIIQPGSEVTLSYQRARIVLIAEGAENVQLTWESDTQLRIELAYTTLLHAGGDVEGVKIDVIRKSDRPLTPPAPSSGSQAE